MIIRLPFSRYSIKIHRIINKSENVPSREIKSESIERNYNKIFCIGFGKTGTTSISKFLQDSGFTLGNQAVAEVLAEDWAVYKRSERIINYCYTADAFQDIPFMYPDLFKVLDKSFPNSKFILTIRDSEDQWYESLINFHTKKFSTNPNRPPNEVDKKNARYRYKGWIYDVSKFFWNYPDTPLYDPDFYKRKYLDHKTEVNEYFKRRSNDFIEINVSRKNDFDRLCEFLNIKTNMENFPWENKT